MLLLVVLQPRAVSNQQDALRILREVEVKIYASEPAVLVFAFAVFLHIDDLCRCISQRENGKHKENTKASQSQNLVQQYFGVHFRFIRTNVQDIHSRA